MEGIGCVIGMMYIFVACFVAAALWYAFAFVMWCIYRHNGGRHGFISYLYVKGLKL